MPSIQVKTRQRDYVIHIESEGLSRVGTRAAALTAGRKAFIFSDDLVGPLYIAAVTASLREAGFQTFSHMLPHGEEQKNIYNLQRIYRLLHQTGVSRTDLIVVLGGGVPGDLVGFAAATWQRGTPYMQIPTSLLAQVDSSVGGKTAIDLPFGKNMVGSFYQPYGVIIDPDTLRTLPDRQIAEGMAEVIKYGCILDAELFERAAVPSPAAYDAEVIARCVSLKAAVVEEDERDQGRRMLLNFGHTLGHAVEKATGFSLYTHGQSVAFGMVMAAAVGEHLGVTQPGTSERISRAVEAWQLPREVAVSDAELTEAVYSDKKLLSGTLNFILLKKIGEAVIYPLAPEALGACLSVVRREEGADA
jgi:3-dehydroquinate synthase